MPGKKLIQEIEQAFKDIHLEDGIGLWEAQGLDDYLTPEECRKLRIKDEKNDWHKIPAADLYKCISSLSFFDAKGMRFHLPRFLFFDLGVSTTSEEKSRNVSESTLFTLTHDLENDYNRGRFSLLNSVQIQCIIHFLEYKQYEIIELYRNFYFQKYGTNPSAVDSDQDYLELEKAKLIWKKKLDRLEK